MATITGLTAERMREIEAASIVSGTINASGHLILTRYDGGTIDAGNALVAFPDDATVKVLEAGPAGYTESFSPETYPVGLSLIYVTDSSTQGWGGVGFASGAVQTIRIPDPSDGLGRASQIFQPNTGYGNEPNLYIRTGIEDYGWTVWRNLATQKYVDDKEAALDSRLDALELGKTVRLLNQGDLGITETTPATSYPPGISILSVGTSSGWSINSGFGMVVTYNHSSARCTQVFHDNSAGGFYTHGIWVRNFHTDNPNWSKWKQIGDEKVNRSSGLTAGTWYRIGEFGVGGTQTDGLGKKATAEFLISTEGSGQHSLLRLRATMAYTRPTLLLEEYTSFSATVQAFTKARIVALNGTYGGAAVEVYCNSMVSDSKIQLAVKHDDWYGSTPAFWTPVNFVSQVSIPAGPAAVVAQRGLGFTSEYIYPTLTNGWVNYGAGYGDACYRMQPGNIVELNGLVKSGTVDANGAAPMFILPAGYRPGKRKLFVVNAGGNTVGRIDVLPTGEVCCAGGVNSYQCMDGLTFLAEQ